MSRETQPVPPEIEKLRQAMDAVRLAQLTGNMAVALARYQAETGPTTQEFLTDFLTALPFDVGYEDNSWRQTQADRFELHDPLDVRTTANFAVFAKSTLYPYKGRASMVIGERSVPASSLELTELLLWSWRRKTDNENDWIGPISEVTPVRVVSSDWAKLRDKSINTLSKPYSNETLMSLLDTDTGNFVISEEKARDIGMARLCVLSAPWREARRPLAKAYKKRWNEAHSTIGYVPGHSRGPLSTDFEEYGVLKQLEYIAAAYGVGEAFDVAKTKRESAMPKHPSEIAFGLPDYRQAIERASYGASEIRLGNPTHKQ